MRNLNRRVLPLIAASLLAASIASGQSKPALNAKGTGVAQQRSTIPHEQVVLENDQVRVLRIHSDPHYVSPMHDHLVPRVVVFLTDFDAKITGANDTPREVKHKAGDVLWRPVERHAVENLSDKPFEQIEIEIKSAAAGPEHKGSN
jgi:uncharacterized spore protein YtfJ